MTESPPDGPGQELFADGKRSGAGSYERGVKTREWTTHAADGTVKSRRNHRGPR